MLLPPWLMLATQQPPPRVLQAVVSSLPRLLCLPQAEPPAASQPAAPPIPLPGLELWGKVVKPQKKRGLYKSSGGVGGGWW